MTNDSINILLYNLSKSQPKLGIRVYLRFEITRRRYIYLCSKMERKSVPFYV
jgi:hypothetical protein